MSGILFFIFASCAPLKIEEIIISQSLDKVNSFRIKYLLLTKLYMFKLVAKFKLFDILLKY